jgi:3-methylcrotonyl-CoA carboxylase alpha subunit
MFSKVLIANRGEIARRVMRTCKRMGIATVAVYSEADADAPHVRDADEAALLGPPPVKESYLRIDRIIEVARDLGVDAVHPGYGLLSENPALARALAEASITFVGPSISALEDFGDKLSARRVAAEAGVAVTPGSDGALDGGDPEAMKRAAEAIGYPLIVKAAAGGGGIGMVIVKKESRLEKSVQRCIDRGASAFGDPRVYLERYVDSPKHIEVQILRDAAGCCVAIGERECSLQRRHQKIIEECPSAAPFFDGEAGAQRRTAIHQAAIDIANHADYLGAGTVEFIAASDGTFYFLEVNARLQVEHCVTEMCSGLDLVEWQLRIAAGGALSDEVRAHQLQGHAIEARIYAEDPAKKFAPQPGKLERLRWPEQTPWLRIESGVREGMEVTPFYDPMIAKLVAHGKDRAQAIARLDEALAATDIELVGPVGPAATNVSFCRRLLNGAAFRDGSYDTAFAETLAKTQSGNAGR